MKAKWGRFFVAPRTPLTLPVLFSPESFRSVLISLRRFESGKIGERQTTKTGGVAGVPKKTGAKIRNAQTGGVEVVPKKLGIS
jgi:hypothetical protein